MAAQYHHVNYLNSFTAWWQQTHADKGKTDDNIITGHTNGSSWALAHYSIVNCKSTLSCFTASPFVYSNYRGQTIYRNRCTRQWQATAFTSTAHISFSSWSRVDCSCSRPSCSCARISSWLVFSSSRANSSFVCFSFTFSTLVTCCSLWRSWHWSSSWRQSQKQKTRKGRTVDKTPKHFLYESVVAPLIGLE